jgi:hypothetical protein
LADRDGDDDEKRQAQERAAAELKETEALLAGFDRPARTPRPAPVAPDFVTYFEKRDPRSPAPTAPAAEPNRRAPLPTADRLGRDRETFVIPRTERRIPRWLAWIGVLGAMPLAGGFIAYLAARDAEPTRAAPAPPPRSAPAAPSTAPPSAEPPSREAPEPPESSLSAPPPSPSSPRTAAPPPSRDPRVDFIRKL